MLLPLHLSLVWKWGKCHSFMEKTFYENTQMALELSQMDIFYVFPTVLPVVLPQTLSDFPIDYPDFCDIWFMANYSFNS